MLSLRVWLRKRSLERALRGYPLYDPPHKVEEHLLSRELAAENFDYFMRVRLARLADFRSWLRQHFGCEVTLDEKGIRALSLWGNKYAGLLLVQDPDGRPTRSFFTYDPPWIGAHAGINVLFDLGIALGEAILANCPELRWELDPLSKLLPNTGKLLKQTSGISFQRPLISGFENPAYRVTPLHQSYTFAFWMMTYTAEAEGIRRFRALSRFDRRPILQSLINFYLAALKEYPEGDPAGLRREMGTEEYLKLVDDEVNQGKADD